MRICDVLTGPKKWTQETSARDTCGDTVPVRSEYAVQFCILGAICKAQGNLQEFIRDFQAVHEGLHPVFFNDKHTTTYEMVVEAVKKCGWWERELGQ